MTETSTGKPTDEMVEVAAQAMWERIDREESWSEIYHASAYRRDARAALEAAAPLIAAAALRDAADWLDDMARGYRESAHLSAGRALISRLRARANEMEADRG